MSSTGSAVQSDASDLGEHIDDESLDLLLAQTLSEAGPHLRPRRKRNYAVEAGEESPTPPTSESSYMDQSVEYGYSSMGRRRKRRVIANNSCEEAVPPAPKKSRPYSAVSAPPGGKKMPNATPTKNESPHTHVVERASERRNTVASNISKYAHSRTFETGFPTGKFTDMTSSSAAHSSQQQRQQLIFQRKDGQQFSINVNQTLLIYSPTLPQDSKVMKISGRQAIHDPSMVDEMLKSDNFGPGATAMIVENRQLTESTITKFINHMNESAKDQLHQQQRQQQQQEQQQKLQQQKLQLQKQLLQQQEQLKQARMVFAPATKPAIVTVPSVRAVTLQSSVPRIAMAQDTQPKRFVQPTTRHSLIKHLIVKQTEVRPFYTL